jgi:hypothetical protein
MKTKSKTLKKALKNVDDLSDDWFGNESANFKDLPSISAKQSITRTSAYINNEDLAYLKKVAKKTHVSVAQITGDIVARFVEKSKKN